MNKEKLLEIADGLQRAHEGHPNEGPTYFSEGAEALRALAAAPAQPVAEPTHAQISALPDIDALAQEIRRVDGNHKMGAGALAEALMPFLRASHGQAPAPAAVAGPSDGRIRECAARLVEHADFCLGGTLSADSKARDIPSNACSQVKSRHLAALRDALAAAPTTQPVPQQEAQEPCPTCAALARTVMLDQVSFDRKPDCYGIRQITDDEGVEEWEDIRTSPDVAREEANDMMATGRGEIYEVVPLWTTPQHAPQPAPDCHHRPPCDECAALATGERG